MNNPDRTTVVILGGGKGGTALLELLTHLPGVEVAGIGDQDASAPALQYARQLEIPITQDLLSLICRPGNHLIVNVTGDLNLDGLVATHKHSETEVLGGAASYKCCGIWFNVCGQNSISTVSNRETGRHGHLRLRDRS